MMMMMMMMMARPDDDDPVVMVVMVVRPVMMMMVVMVVADELRGGGLLIQASRLGGFRRTQHGDRVGNRLEQLGIRPCRFERSQIRCRDGGGLRAVERCQAGNGADQSGHRLVHVELLGGRLVCRDTAGQRVRLPDWTVMIACDICSRMVRRFGRSTRPRARDTTGGQL